MFKQYLDSLQQIILLLMFIYDLQIKLQSVSVGQVTNADKLAYCIYGTKQKKANQQFNKLKTIRNKHKNKAFKYVAYRI